MITRIVKMTFKKGEINNFLANFEKHKAQIRAFEGCEKLLLLQDMQNPNVYFTYSWWQADSNLEAYRHSDLFQGVWAYTKSLFAAKPEAWSTEQIESL